jgi:hypothetical protein
MASKGERAAAPAATSDSTRPIRMPASYIGIRGGENSESPGSTLAKQFKNWRQEKLKKYLGYERPAEDDDDDSELVHSADLDDDSRLARKKRKTKSPSADIWETNENGQKIHIGFGDYAQDDQRTGTSRKIRKKSRGRKSDGDGGGGASKSKAEASNMLEEILPIIKTAALGALAGATYSYAQGVREKSQILQKITIEDFPQLEEDEKLCELFHKLHVYYKISPAYEKQLRSCANHLISIFKSVVFFCNAAAKWRKGYEYFKKGLEQQADNYVNKSRTPENARVYANAQVKNHLFEYTQKYPPPAVNSTLLELAIFFRYRAGRLCEKMFRLAREYNNYLMYCLDILLLPSYDPNNVKIQLKMASEVIKSGRLPKNALSQATGHQNVAYQLDFFDYAADVEDVRRKEVIADLIQSARAMPAGEGEKWITERLAEINRRIIQNEGKDELALDDFLREHFKYWMYCMLYQQKSMRCAARLSHFRPTPQFSGTGHGDPATEDAELEANLRRVIKENRMRRGQIPVPKEDASQVSHGWTAMLKKILPKSVRQKMEIVLGGGGGGGDGDGWKTNGGTPGSPTDENIWTFLVHNGIVNDESKMTMSAPLKAKLFHAARCIWKEGVLNYMMDPFKDYIPDCRINNDLPILEFDTDDLHEMNGELMHVIVQYRDSIVTMLKNVSESSAYLEVKSLAARSREIKQKTIRMAEEMNERTLAAAHGPTTLADPYESSTVPLGTAAAEFRTQKYLDTGGFSDDDDDDEEEDGGDGDEEDADESWDELDELIDEVMAEEEESLPRQ